MNERIYAEFQKSVEATMQVGEDLINPLGAAAQQLVNTLLDDKKILTCGNGACSSLGQIFTSSMLDRFERERPSLPAIWLGGNIAAYTSVSADFNDNDMYAKSVRALGQEGDSLLIISTTGNSNNLTQAVSAAHDRGLHVISLCGRDGGDISSLLDTNDVEICVPLKSQRRILEVHMLSLFCLADLIDFTLFGIE